MNHLTILLDLLQITSGVPCLIKGSIEEPILGVYRELLLHVELLAGGLPCGSMHLLRRTIIYETSYEIRQITEVQILDLE